MAEIARVVDARLTDSSTGYEWVRITGDWREPLRASLFPFPFETWAWDNRSFS